MKRIILITMILLSLTSKTMADEVLVGNMTVPQGGTAVLSIEFNNADEYRQFFQFDITLPEGLTLDISTAKLGTRFDGTAAILSNSELTTRHYRFLCFDYSMDTMQGNSGALMTVEIHADASLDVGSEWEASVTEIELTKYAGTQAWNTDDFTFTITIGEPDDGRLKFDELATSLPTFSDGEKADVTMKRTIKAGIWNTLVLPFTLTQAKVNAIFGSDVQFAEFTGFSTDYADGDDDVTPDDITINFSTYTLSARKPLTGGKPFLVKTSSDIDEFEADDVTLVGAITATQQADEWETKGKFTGSFVKSIVPEDGLFINENNFWYSTGNTSIKGFRCWLELDAVLDKETSFGAKVAFIVDGEPTAVEGLDVRLSQTGAVYNLKGQKVGTDTDISRLPKGIYIVNGQKKVIK